MERRKLYAAWGAALCLCIPAAVWALRQGGTGALRCPDPANPICGLYAVCRPILDGYPEAEITAEGKDCTLTVESSQLIIRRKRVDGAAGYYFSARRRPAGGEHPYR